jgi:hypothetical protein
MVMSETTMGDLFQADVLHWGRLYIARQWYVFPCWTVDEEGRCTCPLGGECPDIGKHPIGDLVPNGFKNASCDLAKVEEWWGPGTPPRNIAIATGKVSGITVIDIDGGPGKVGMQSWVELIRGKGEPKTLMAHTGGGGVHLFFQYEPKMGKSRSNYLGSSYKHIDLRNDGGYIIAPPSRHRSSGRYEWPTNG